MVFRVQTINIWTVCDKSRIQTSLRFVDSRLSSHYLWVVFAAIVAFASVNPNQVDSTHARRQFNMFTVCARNGAECCEKELPTQTHTHNIWLCQQTHNNLRRTMKCETDIHSSPKSICLFHRDIQKDKKTRTLNGSTFEAFAEIWNRAMIQIWKQFFFPSFWLTIFACIVCFRMMLSFNFLREWRWRCGKLADGISDVKYKILSTIICVSNKLNGPQNTRRTVPSFRSVSFLLFLFIRFRLVQHS